MFGGKIVRDVIVAISGILKNIVGRKMDLILFHLRLQVFFCSLKALSQVYKIFWVYFPWWKLRFRKECRPPPFLNHPYGGQCAFQ